MSQPQPSGHRTQIAVAVIAAVGAIVVAVVTGVLPLFSGGPSSASSVVADGGSSTNHGSCVSGGVVVQGTVNCGASRPAPSGAKSLRLTVAPQDPGVYHVAFDHDIGLPSERTRYLDLLAKGGSDVAHSVQHLTLANRSDKPLTITDVEVEVVGVKPPLRAALAYVFTQGDTGYSQFAAQLDQATVGAKADLYDVLGNVPGYNADPPGKPVFSQRYVSLKPGEIYEAEVTVSVPNTSTNLLEYRFVVSGSTADKPYTVASATVSRVSGAPPNGYPEATDYSHSYVYGYLTFMKGSNALGCGTVQGRAWYAVPAAGLSGTCRDIVAP
jgi:hypothetical protein